MSRIRKYGAAATVGLGSALVAATPAFAQGTEPNYTALTSGLKDDAVAGVNQVLPIVGTILAIVIVVGLIRKFAKSK